MTEGTQRRLAAIVAADVAGYSRLVGADEEGTLEALRGHRRDFIEPAIETHNGRIANTAGDSFLMEFSSVVDAVRCAIAIQDGLADRNAEVPQDRRILMRIGINVGDVVAEDGDLLGDGVNIAARLEALAEPGGIALSDDAYRQVRDRMKIDWFDAGEHEVKNIARPVHVWRWAPHENQQAQDTALVSEVLELPDKPSIAVLPFDNMSGDMEQEYFVDGMTEDIITELSRFEELFVIARNTTYTYKGTPASATGVARELGVHYVLEGSVRKAGERVRITAQLIEGSGGGHIWAERYDGAIADIFDLQEDVTRQVVGSIARRIFREQVDQSDRRDRVFDESYELAWKARHTMQLAFAQREPKFLSRAIEISTEAVRMNSKCGLAYQTVSYAYVLQNLMRWGPDPFAAADLALDWAQRLHSVMPHSYMAYRSLGAAKLRKGLYREANRDFERAHELNPNDALVLFTWSLCEASAGDVTNAKKHAQMGIRLSPKDGLIGNAYLALAMAAFIEGDDDEFEGWGSKAIQAMPTAPIRRALMIAYGAATGDQELIKTHRTELMRFAPNFIDSLFRGENKLFDNPEHTAMLLDGLRNAGFSE